MALNVPGNKLRHCTFPDSGGSLGVKQAVLNPADAGYHSNANMQHLHDHNIPALIADNNQMREAR